MKRFTLVALFFITTLFFFAPLAASKNTPHITMNLPESILSGTLKKILPLQLETASKTLEGTITIISIDKLKLRKGKLSCLLKLKAENLHVVTEVSGHKLRIRIGTIDLSFNTDATLRFDPKEQTLYIKANISDQKTGENGGSNDIGKTLLALLNGREYPIELQKLEPLVAEASNKTVTIQMNIADIKSIDKALQLSLVPVISTKQL